MFGWFYMASISQINFLYCTLTKREVGTFFYYFNKLADLILVCLKASPGKNLGKFEINWADVLKSW